MSGTKRALMLILAVMLMGCLLCATSAVALEGGHDCCGEDCPVCALINLCENVIKSLGVVLAVVLSAGAILFAVPRFSNRAGLSQVFSPVYLKVKLSN